MFRNVLKTLAKAILILVGMLALVGGGVCVATTLAFVPDLRETLIPLLVSVVGWILLQWGINLRRTEEAQDRSAGLPHDHTHEDQ